MDQSEKNEDLTKPSNGSSQLEEKKPLDLKDLGGKGISQERIEINEVVKRLLNSPELQIKHKPDYESEMGSSSPIEEPDVDISLHPSRAVPVAGELWSISGEIYNRSSQPIWIVDDTSVLTLAPEIYGQSSNAGSQTAFFPTVPSRPISEVVRIDPGAKYSVVWKIDPLATSGEKTPPSLSRRIRNAVRNYAFFNPGEFRITSTIHIWSDKPKFERELRVSNIGDSFAKSISQTITMDSSPWVLVIGAAVGGLLCHLLQILSRFISGAEWGWRLASDIFVGIPLAIILSGIVTVLLSRLATSDFLIVVKVKDIWGAIATGFTVQWVGYSVLQKILSSASEINNAGQIP